MIRNRRIVLTAADLADIKRMVPNGAAGARYREVSLPIWTRVSFRGCDAFRERAAGPLPTIGHGHQLHDMPRARPRHFPSRDGDRAPSATRQARARLARALTCSVSRWTLAGISLQAWRRTTRGTSSWPMWEYTGDGVTVFSY